MKFLFVLLSVLALSGVTMATEAKESQDPLDGKSYCRIIISEGGFFGQPAGKRLHCLTFNDGEVTDNASTSFGNPPQSFVYAYGENLVQFSNYLYVLTIDQKQLVAVKGSALTGVVFELQKAQK